MGRKSSMKSKEKRLQRKEEQQRISHAMSVVNEANKLIDPLEPFPVFRKFSKNDQTAELSIKRVKDLDENQKNWVFDLTKRNMQEKYEECLWGWNDERKLEEMMDDSAWYLIAQANDGRNLGFSHFRFDLDDGVEVLYCYELQLEPFVRRKGLGKFMMQILELVAFKNSMKKVVLTVLKNNEFSQFFKALNYKTDESSPVDNEHESYTYEILSKFNKHLISGVGNEHVINLKRVHCCGGHCF